MSRFSLVGVGNPVYDTIITPWTNTGGRILSGCSTNACLAARRLGMESVGLVGCIGQDFAERFARDMKSYGVEARTIVSGTESGGFHLAYDQKGNRTLDVLGVAGKITSKDFPASFLESEFLLVGPILGEVDFDLLKFVRSSSQASIFLDPQGLVRTIGHDRRIVHECNQDQFKRILGLVDYVKPNEHEAETITGEKDPAVAIRRLHDWGAEIPIVTLGERGSLLLMGNKLHHIAAYGTSAVDPTGAGDVYAGSFITEYARTGDCVEAALFASAAASLKVEHSGPDFFLPTKTVQERKDFIRDRSTAEAA